MSRGPIRRLIVLIIAAAVVLTGAVLAPAAYADTPTEIDSPAVTAGNGLVDVTFTADPNSTRYEASAELNDTDVNESNWHSLTITGDDGAGSLTGRINGLQNGTTYYIRVRGVDADGNVGPTGTPSSVVPGLPGVPSLNVTAGSHRADVSFTPPPDGGFTLDRYEVSVTQDGSLFWTRTLSTTPGADGQITFDVTETSDGQPLANGTFYTVAVRAHNQTGYGVEGTYSFAPDEAPPTPTITKVVASTQTTPSVTGTASATVDFDAGPQNDSSDTTYLAVADPNGASNIDPCVEVTSRHFRCVVTQLTNGLTYTFTVTATNASGLASTSVPSDKVTPVGAPYAPESLQRVSVTPRSVTVSFVPPVFSGSAVTEYQITTDGGKTWRTVPTQRSGSRRLATATGLASGTRYTVQVRARNVIYGQLRAGVPSSKIVILNGPGTVGRPSVRSGTSAALVYWRASPQRDVVGYTVYASRGGAICSTQTRVETACIIGARAGVKTSYRVVAHSAAGPSYASAPTRTVAAASPYVPKKAPAVPGGFASHPSKVTSGKKATLTARGFLPGSSVTLVVYGKKRHIVSRFVAGSAGTFRVTVTVPKDKAKRLTFMAFGVTEYASSKAIAASVKRS